MYYFFKNKYEKNLVNIYFCLEIVCNLIFKLMNFVFYRGLLEGMDVVVGEVYVGNLQVDYSKLQVELYKYYLQVVFFKYFFMILGFVWILWRYWRKRFFGKINLVDFYFNFDSFLFK